MITLVELHTLRKPIPEGSLSSDVESPQVFTTTGTGWTVNQHSGGGAFGYSALWKGYIDLSGYTREGKTWFTRAVQVQGPNYLDSTSIMMQTVYDIVTEEPMSDDDLSLCIYNHLPGTALSTVDSANVIYGRIRVWGPRQFAGTGLPLTTTLGATNQTLMSEDFFGTNSGSARDKLHCYRILWFYPIPGVAHSMLLGASQYVLSGAVDKEEDLEYIMRLKRAYETAPPFS